MNTKICKKCGKELPMNREYFHKDKYSKDGYRIYCKKCFNEGRKKWKKNTKEKTEIDFDINVYQNVEVVQKFKKLYLEGAMPFNEIRKATGLSIGNVNFLIDILQIRLSSKQLLEIRRKNRIKRWNELRPSKEELEKQYGECNYSMCNLRRKFFRKIPPDMVSKWFCEYNIPRRWAIKYKSSEDRLKNIIETLKKKG